ncbi:MAG TPA: Xaa-Pro peptidase family protein [Pyrinomonadaceae bacterium]|nr:Xaa-Pro peptidase family protein [Pyrinomonadaceae bacterium]
MLPDNERISRSRLALKDAKFDALACALPGNVLLLSGYWPVIGTSIAVFSSDGGVTLLVPNDEKQLAEGGWADEVITFSTGSLGKLKSLAEAVEPALKKIGIRFTNAKIGFENGPANEPVSYASMNYYGAAIKDLLHSTFPGAWLVPADETLSRLRAVLTPDEIDRTRNACSIAADAFAAGSTNICEGMAEKEIAAAFWRKLSLTDGRAGGFTFCMSGENSYEAFAAFQLSGARCVQTGDLALVHCNSFVNGFWTDISRTYCIGEPDKKKQKMYEAVFASLDAAIAAIRPGAAASAVDRAAREVLTERGFGAEFKHGLGHGVGFDAIDHNAPPRLHPASTDVLETGMVLNVEPAIYIEGYGGMRHCDMVAVGTRGVEILTDFQRTPAEMVVNK